jgi:putative transcriptional regulator
MNWRLGLLLAALLGSAPMAPAQTAGSANGVFLVASPVQLDPNFRRSVVLVTQMTGGGSVGFIMNRPGPRSLAQILPDNKLMQRFTEPIYLGGPVEATGLFAVFRAGENPPGALRVLSEVSFAMDPAVLEQLLHTPPSQVRFFNGYAGWAPGQLARELSRGGWLALNADADTVFRKDTDTLWQELLVRARALSATRPPGDTAAAADRGGGDQLSAVSSDTPRRARRVSHRLGR